MVFKMPASTDARFIEVIDAGITWKKTNEKPIGHL
jgi:hypothetical protein